jgi:hypothetical protein
LKKRPTKKHKNASDKGLFGQEKYKENEWSRALFTGNQYMIKNTRMNKRALTSAQKNG